ncbi:hypothetical protein AB0M43_05745 [Longispora sp. NPDC051575]|uniref:hypothetical protein n=1 Tax=Longispora sp. NPDC051575 TaxID=3154943 RepID=UPI0034363550
MAIVVEGRAPAVDFGSAPALALLLAGAHRPDRPPWRWAWHVPVPQRQTCDGCARPWPCPAGRWARRALALHALESWRRGDGMSR